MNFLEQVVAEWFSYEGYFVKTNIKFGKLPRGGFTGEMDVVAFHPKTRELVHIETEPPRDFRRLHFLRGWGHGKTKQILTRG